MTKPIIFKSPRNAMALRRRLARWLLFLLLCALSPDAVAGGFKIMVCSTRRYGSYYQLPYNVIPQFSFEGEIPDGVYGFNIGSMERDSGNWIYSSATVEIKGNRVLPDSPNTSLRPQVIGAPGPGNWGYGWTLTRVVSGQLYSGTVAIPDSKVSAGVQRFIEWDRGDIPEEEFWPLLYGGAPPIPLVWKITISAHACSSCQTCVTGADGSGSGASVGPDSSGWSPAITAAGGYSDTGGGANNGTGSGLDVTAGLGLVAYGNSAGTVSLQASELSAGLVARGSLLVAANAGVEVIKDSTSVIRQLVSSNLLTDIVQVNASKLEIRQYAAGDKGAKGADGFYAPTGAAIRTTAIENPMTAGQPDTSKLIVTKTGGENTSTTFSFDAATSSWTSSKDNGARQESVSKQWNADRTERTETYQIKNAQNLVVHEEQNTYRAFTWGEEKIVRILGPSLPANQQQKWTWEFYTDSSQTGKYSRLKTTVAPSRFWETYDYDSEGRASKRVSQFLDAPPGSLDGDSRVVTTSYSDINPLKTVVETLKGIEVRREYESATGSIVNHIRATVAGAAWNEPSNLISSTDTINSGIFFGQPRSVRNLDGTMTLYNYAVNGENKTTTVSTGRPNAGGTALIAGTATVSTVNGAGGKLSEITSDIASGLLLSSSNTATTDAAGRPTLIQYMDGRSESFSYGCCGLDAKTERDGTTTFYTYDADRRVKTESRAGITLIYGYDAAGRKVSTIRRGSDSTDTPLETTAYDVAGRAISVTTPRGSATFAEIIDPSGRTMRTSTLPDAGVKIETFAQDHSLLNVTGSGAHPVRYEYGSDVAGKFTKEIRLGPLGQATEWTQTYTDLAGREYKTLFPDGATAQKFYNGQGQLAKEVDPDGVTRLFSYNAKGEQEFSAVDINRNSVIDTTGPDQVIQSTTEAATARNVTVARTTSSAWTETGVVPLSVLEKSADGLQSWETRYGQTTRRQTSYSGNGARAETVTAPDGSYVISQYQAGRLTSAVSYDNAGAKIRGTTYFYDGHGRLLRQTDARNGATSYTYDAAGQVRSARTPPAAPGVAAQTTSYDYDGQGRVTQTILPGNKAVRYEYFPTGELKKQYGAQTYPVDYTYDAQGRIKTLRAGTGTTTWNYDPQRGWLSAKLYDDGNGPGYTYTQAGRLRTRLWARGITTTYGYDDAGELSGITYSDSTPPVTYIRDRQNRITNITDAAGNHVLTYGPANQLGSDTISGGLLDGVAVINGYDGFQRRNTLQYKQNGNSVVSQTYGYDNASRLASVGNGAVSTTYGYVPNSDLIGTVLFKNGSTPVMTTTKSYDNLNRVTLTSTTNTSGTVLSSFGYDYNALNQRTKASVNDGSYWRYGYDDLGQVTSGEKHWGDGSAVGGEQFGYSFDNIGNRTSTNINGRSAAYSPNGMNQYTSRTVPGTVDVIGSAAPEAKVTVNNQPTARKGDYFYKALSFDNAAGPVQQPVSVVGVKNNVGPNGEDAVTTESGNVFLSQTPEGFIYDYDGNLTQDGRWTYTWDGENRLIGMTALTSVPASAKKKLLFEYDHQSRRIQKRVYDWNSTTGGYETAPATTLRFIYDGWNLIAEVGGTNAPVRKYLWGLDLSGTTQGAGGVAGLLAETDASNAAWLPTYDGNGNISALFKAADGSAGGGYEYGPFGEIVRATGVAASGNPFGFSTKYSDAESGFLYYGFRYLQPMTGRWLIRDPLEETGGLNLYGFVSNNPISSNDPLGLLAWDVATYYSYPQFIRERAEQIGGLTVPRLPEVTAACRCGPNGGYILEELKVKLSMDVYFAQGWGSRFKAWVKEREHQHEDDLRAWADNEGFKKAQAQEAELKKEKFITEEICKSMTSQAAYRRIRAGWDQAASDSHNRHDRPGQNHPYPPGAPLFD